jgi:hypothetical protein
MTTSIVAPEILDLSSIVSGAIRPVAAKLLTPGVACPGTSDALCPRRERVKGRSSQ